MKIKCTEAAILAALQENCYITNVQLARTIGLSPPPTLRAVRKMFAEGFIRKTQAQLSLPLLELVEYHVLVQTRKEKDDQFHQWLRAAQAVRKAMWLDSGDEYLLTLILRPAQLQGFLTALGDLEEVVHFSCFHPWQLIKDEVSVAPEVLFDLARK